MEQLQRDNIKVEPVFLNRLENWFTQRVKTKLSEQQFSTKIEAGAEAKAGLPLVGNLFAKLTNAISLGSAHKDEIREIVRNSYGEFSDAFNSFIQHVNEQLNATNKAKKIVFIVDGTDRLSSIEAEDFFIGNVDQLKQIHSYFIYCTPIHILQESSRVHGMFNVFRLPMVKIVEKNSSDYFPVPLNKLSELIAKRVDARLFVADTVTHNLFTYNAVHFELIKYSGGHIRDLMRLLDYCLAETLGRKKIDIDVAKQAIKQLANDYRRVILENDYALLIDIDNKDKNYTPASEQSRRLLYNLVLLEYDYWWQTHPAVQTLAAYQQALQSYL
jgi:hypothetical protein